MIAQQKSKVQAIFFVLTTLALVLSSCQGAPPPTPTATPSPSPTATPLPSATPTDIPQPTVQPPIAYLVDVENAMFQVESEGKYFSPKFAEVSRDPGRGSGFILDPSGLAITSNQAVTGAEEVRVWLGTDQTKPYNAKILATAECNDLAVIDIDGEGFEYLAWSDAPLEQGQKVYIAGYPIGSKILTLSSGNIQETTANGGQVSGSASPLTEYNISAEPGLGGGPLLTPAGKIIGVHIGSAGAAAFGFTRDSLSGKLESLLAGQSLGGIGVNGQAVNSEDGTLSGMWAFAVQPDSPASRIGIAGGDLITRIDDQYLSGEQILSQYCSALESWDGQSPLNVQVYRPSEQTLLEGELNGKELAAVGDEIAAPAMTPEAGTPAAPNLAASRPGDVIYREEFDNPLTNWTRFVLQGDEEKVTVELKDSKLIMTIDEIFTYVYYIFKPFKTTDVRLDIRAENLGRNNNNISLICRYSIERGWYEFNIASNGLYWVKRYDPRFNNYFDIGKGASQLIKLGQETNDYGAVCRDNKLTLFINGKEIRTFTDNTLVTGQVGFSIASFNVTPVTVAVDYFKVSVP